VALQISQDRVALCIILLEVHRADLDKDLELVPNKDISGDGNVAIGSLVCIGFRGSALAFVGLSWLAWAFVDLHWPGKPFPSIVACRRGIVDEPIIYIG
jgi:hypothetical protein